ncbi:MAG: histidine phosphatase family protein [Myxococcota bacterium]|jgi:alpha-ribazole phosphatase|nr:histidine phosphatase family protein [Myxococcota bacterium]
MALMAMLITIRHAPTIADGLCVGQYDVATELTHDEAAERMRLALGASRERPDVDRVWSSTRSRCREPAARLARALGVPHTIDPRLLELDYGIWEGRAWDTIAREDGARMHAWMNAWQTTAPPGGESVATLEARVRGWWETLDATPVLVAHAGVVRALRVVARGLTWAEAMRGPVPHLEVEPFPLAR